MSKTIREYSVILKDGSELHTEDKAETDTFFFEESGVNAVSQYFRKDWIINNDEPNSPREDYVKVYYSETRA